ncbi:MAG: serine protease Do, partial [Cyclobacteriaceae bacterium]
MDTRKLIVAMTFSSVLGGVIAIGGYSLIADKEQAMPVQVAQSGEVSFTNMVLDTTNYVVPEGLNFVYAANSATNTVVHVRTIYDGSEQEGSADFEGMLREYFGDDPRQGRRPSRGSGSGVIISDQGHIVTNHHVVDGASSIEIMLNDNSTYEAKIIGLDPTTDLAVLKVEGASFVPMKWGNSDQLQLGEWVLAVGNPFEFRSTVTA